jgi:hypothetical protein
MLASRLFKLLVVAAFFTACNKELPELDGIDKKEWIADKNGCLLKRRGMIDAVQKEKLKLLSLDEMQIVALLGKPDHNELYKRNQKFYNYYLQGYPGCSDATDTIAMRLVIRFNAVGLANEVSVER